MGKRTKASGQAILEYILLLSIILSLSGALIASVKGTRDKIWKRMICDVSAVCAECKATDSAKSILKAKADCK